MALTALFFLPLLNTTAHAEIPDSAIVAVKNSLVAPLNRKPLSGGISHDSYGLTNDYAFLESQVNAHPDDPEARFLLAVAYSRTPYAERALEELDIARKLTRKSKEGFALFDRKIAEYERMLQKNPEDTLVIYRLGFAYYMRGYAVANGYIKKPAQLLNNRPPNYFYDQSEKTFRHLIEVDNTDISAMNYLGYLLAERAPETNYNEAVSLWKRSIAVNRENPGAYMLLGQAEMKRGNLRQAIAYSALALQYRNAWLEAHQVNPERLKIRL